MSTSVIDSQQLDLVFSALSHPVRRKILSKLKSGKARVTDLAAPFDMTLPAITKHLKVLEKANLINRSQVAQVRYSHLNPIPLKEANDWLIEYEEFWRQRFDRLEKYVNSIRNEEK